MAVKIFKLLSITAGGILALGGGAVGMHFAEPTLERNFYPERLKKEEKLQKAFRARSNEVDLKKQQIKSLEKQLASKEANLVVKKELYESQKRNISSLESSVKEKSLEITRKKAEKDQIQSKLDELNYRINLQKEDILKGEALDLDLLRMDLKKIEWKSFNGDRSTFEATKSDGTKVTFQVTKENISNHEKSAKKIKDSGIAFQLQDTFKRWDKQIVLYIYDAGYDHKPQQDKEKENYVFNKQTFTLKLDDYFQEDYHEDAFKVYLAISYLESLPLKYDMSNLTDNLFNFNNNYYVPELLFDSDAYTWKEFTGEVTGKMSIWTSRFKTKNDFVKYWISKTIEFIKYRRVDLLEALNPVVLSKNYQ